MPNSCITINQFMHGCEAGAQVVSAPILDVYTFCLVIIFQAV